MSDSVLQNDYSNTRFIGFHENVNPQRPAFSEYFRNHYRTEKQGQIGEIKRCDMFKLIKVVKFQTFLELIEDASIVNREIMLDFTSVRKMFSHIEPNREHIFQGFCICRLQVFFLQFSVGGGSRNAPFPTQNGTVVPSIG